MRHACIVIMTTVLSSGSAASPTPDVSLFSRTPINRSVQTETVAADVSSVNVIAEQSPGQSPESWKVTSKHKTTSGFTFRPFDLALSARGGFTLPMGSYYRGMSGGIGFEGDLKYCVSPKLSLFMLLSRAGTKASDDFRLGIRVNKPFVITRETYKFRATRYYIGLQFTNPVDRRVQFPNMRYGWLALGAVSHKTTVTVDLLDTLTHDRIVGVTESFNDTRFAQAGALGYIFRLSESIGVDFCLAFEAVWTKLRDTRGSELYGMNGLSLDFKTGVVYLIGTRSE